MITRRFRVPRFVVLASVLVALAASFVLFQGSSDGLLAQEPPIDPGPGTQYITPALWALLQRHADGDATVPATLEVRLSSSWEHIAAVQQAITDAGGAAADGWWRMPTDRLLPIMRKQTTYSPWVFESYINQPANATSAWHLGLDDDSWYAYQVRNECSGPDSSYTAWETVDPYVSSGASGAGGASGASGEPIPQPTPSLSGVQGASGDFGSEELPPRPGIEDEGGTQVSQPDRPTGLSATVAGTMLTITWDAMPRATGYKLRYKKFEGSNRFAGVEFSDVSGTTYALTGLDPDTEYIIRVRAVNESGNSRDAILRARTE